MNRITSIPRIYVFILLAIVAAAAILVILNVIKVPSRSPLSNVFQKKPTVAIKSAYNIPFNKETQYVNPFDTYKNPFVTNK